MIKILRYIIFFALFTGLFACSGTKSLKKDEELYVGSKLIVKKQKTNHDFEIKNFGMKLTKVYLAVWDVPNGAFLGTPYFRLIPARLIVYNWFYNEKEKGFSYWMRNNFGEEPRLLQDIQPELKTLKLIEKYENLGHFGTTGSYELKYRRNKKKVFINYYLEVAEAFSYRSVQILLDSSQKALQGSINSFNQIACLHPGDEFNLDSIRFEKNQLWKHLVNNGHYYLKETDIIFEADTSIGGKKVDLRIRIDDDITINELSVVKIEKYTIAIDSIVQKPSEDYYYRYANGKIKKQMFDSIIRFKNGQMFSLNSAANTSQLLNSLGIFKNAYISYLPKPNDSLNLYATLNLIPAQATNVMFRLNANYKTAGYIGPSLGVKLSQLNVSGKADNLKVDIDTYYDFPIGLFRKRVSNSSGITLRTEIIAPFVNSIIRLPRTPTSLPFHFASINMEYNNRYDYFKLISLNASYGLSWKTTKSNNFRLELLSATFSDILESTMRFDSLVAQDPSLEVGLVNQFIIGSAINYSFDKRRGASQTEGLFFQGHIETAGNVLSLASLLFSKKPMGEMKIFNIKYSQFVQLSYDLRYFKKIGRIGMLAFRNVGGLGQPYGNSSNMPYIRQFFIGGTNSLRPLTARSVGPGRYLELEKGEVNQVGDIKLELNVEYRIKLGNRLNWAFWSDAGNIWLLKDDPSRPLTGIRWNKIIQDSYLTAGVGLRFDATYIILRCDYGALLYAPIFLDGKKWIWQNKLPLFGTAIGFGYPF